MRQRTDLPPPRQLASLPPDVAPWVALEAKAFFVNGTDHLRAIEPDGAQFDSGVYVPQVWLTLLQIRMLLLGAFAI